MTVSGAASSDTGKLLREAALAGPHIVVMVGRLLKDPVVGWRRKAVAGALVGYVVSPLDVIPRSIPLLGRLDDVVLLAAAVQVLAGGVPPEVLRRHWPGSDESFEVVATLTERVAEMMPRQVRRLLAV